MPESTETPTPTPIPEYTQTLNDLLSTAAAEWSPTDRLALVESLRNQRERWNVEQSTGSRKRVTSKQVSTTKAAKKPKGLSLAGLKL